MIPVLYTADETSFTSEGLGRFAEAISCSVKEARNGAYELTMTYPADGQLFNLMDTGMFVKAKPDDTSDLQPFRIKRITTPLNGKVTVYAQHRTYDLVGTPVLPFTATGIVAALQGIKNNSAITNDFVFSTNIVNTTTEFKVTVPTSARSCLGGIEGSILDLFSGPNFGEFKWEANEVKFLNHRGADNGVRILYGKNMTDLNKEKSEEELYTGVMAYWTDSENGTVVRSAIQYVDNHQNYPVEKIFIMDATSDFESQPTVEQLNARARTYRDANDVGVPRVNIKVSFVPLWQSEEYKNIAPLERVSLCDTVTVYYEKYGVNATAKVIETDYDVLKERYNSITLGDAKSRLGETIQQKINETVKQKAEETTSFLEEAIDHATELITGGDGGYVAISRDASGKPYEILIMDNEDKTQAVNVIRMNQNGIGFSTTGYNGPFTTAWTIDGGFVADFIKSGTIDAININGSNISGSNITGSVMTFGTGTGQVTAENSTWYSWRELANIEGVLFHGQGAFGIQTKKVDFNLTNGDGFSAKSESSNNTYVELRAVDPDTNGIRSSLACDNITGASIGSIKSGATYSEYFSTDSMMGYADIGASSGITLNSHGTISLNSTGRTNISSPSYVIVNSDTWAYLGNYIANGGTYFAAGKDDNRVFIRTNGEGHYCKWATVNGVKCLVEDS